MKRPGWVAFAAVISITVGVFYILASLGEFSDSHFIVQTSYGSYNLWHHHLFWWGVWDMTIGIIAVIAGFSIWRGGAFGLFVGLTGAGFGALRWLFYIPAA